MDNSVRQILLAGAILSLMFTAGCASSEDPGVSVTAATRERTGVSSTELPAGVVFRTDADSYSPGATILLTLENRSSSRVGYNICSAFIDLERFEAEEWKGQNVNLGPDEISVCTAEMRSLGTGASDTSRVYLPSDLPAGSYRLVHEAEIDGERRKLFTNEFDVA